MGRCPYCEKQFNYPDEYIHAKWCKEQNEKEKNIR